MKREYVYRDPNLERFNTPTMHEVHIDAAMSNISIAYKNDTYIADKVFPIVKVKKQSDKYFKFDKDSWFRNEAAVRAPGTRSPRTDYSLNQPGLYQCVEYAAASGLPDEIRENADDPLRPEVEKTEFVTDKLLLKLEKIVSTAVFTAGNWTNTGTPSGGVWSGDTSDPINDIVGPSKVNETIRQAIGRRPNTCILGANVYAALKRHPDLVARLQYTRNRGIVNAEDLANFFDVETVLVGDPIINSAAEGATASYADVWGSSAWFGFVTKTPGLMTPSAGYIITWQDRQTNRYREDQEHQDVFEALMSFDVEITSADSGYLLTSVV